MLSYDAITSIVQAMPFASQYSLAADLFPGSKGANYVTKFAEDKVYMMESVSRVFDDLPSSCVTKYGIELPDQQQWTILLDTPVYSLPNYPLPPLHKIPTWQKLHAAGHVGPYRLRLTNRFSTPLEHFEVNIEIESTNNDTNPDFIATIDAEAYDNNQELIMSGMRICPLNSNSQSSIQLIPTSTSTQQYNIKYCHYRQQDIYQWPKDNALIYTTNPPWCHLTDYTVGLNQEQMHHLLHCTAE